MRLHSDICFTVFEDFKEQKLEIGVSDEIGEHVDVLVSHERKGVNEELQLVNEHLVHIERSSEVELIQARRVVVTLVINHPDSLVLAVSFVLRVHIVEEAELCHHFEVTREAAGSLSLNARHVRLIEFVDVVSELR